MSNTIKYDRRRFLIDSVTTLAVTELALIGFPGTAFGKAEPINKPTAKQGISPSFDSIKQVNAGVLNVGYVEAGPADGAVVLLLHGWPYDIHSFAEVTPALVAKGYRVIIPYLRGYGTTTFLSAQTIRNGQQSALATDIIALMDVLKIRKAILAGFDWGARTACILGALWPDRCKAMVSVSGYLIGNQEAWKKPLPPGSELQWWYQFYFAVPGFFSRIGIKNLC
ncbi:MAG: alpha/beta fold hydrolase [Bacteroidota bacterium]